MSIVASQLNMRRTVAYNNSPEDVPHHVEHQSSVQQNSNLTLKDLLAIINRNKLILFATMFLVMTATILYTLSIKPSYRANAILQIEREAVSIVDFGQIRKSAGIFDANKDPFFRTRYEMLRGRVLSHKVIQSLGLADSLTQKNQKSLASFTGIKSFLKNLIGAKKVVSTVPHAIDYNELFQSHLSIRPISGTYLVEIFYEAPSPEEAQQVVSKLIDEFIKLQIDTKSETGEYAKNFLSKQLLESGERLEKAEKALANYANKKNILGIDNKNSRHIKKFKNLDSVLVTAEVERIKTESLYLQIKNGGVVSALLTNTVISELKARKYQLDSELRKSLMVYKSKHSKIVGIRQQLYSVESKLKEEYANIKAAMKSDYLAAKRQEESIRGELSSFGKEMQTLQNSNLHYNKLMREVQSSEKLYNSLLQRLEEVNVASAANTSNISILEPAVLPFNKYRPRLKINVLIGLLSGFVLSIGLIFLRESFKTQSINTFEELEKRFFLPVLGRVPRVKKRKTRKQLDKIVSTMPYDPVAEAYQILSANIQLMFHGFNQRVLLMTSVHAGEGKSVTASNLACAYALMGKRVLLIDADLRKPSLHTKIGIDNNIGLSNYLKGETNIVGITQPVQDVSGLFIITAGEAENDPVSLLSNDRMKHLVNQGATVFDYVIIDGPPAIGFADSLLLSSLVTSTLIIANEKEMDANEIGFVLNKFKRIKDNVIGFSLIKVKTAEARDKYYLGYRKCFS